MRIAGNRGAEHTRRVEKAGRPGLGWLCVMVFLGVAFGSGCTVVREKSEPSAEVGYQKGVKDFEKENYSDAIPHFQNVLENYPFSVYAVSAELKIAECYFYDEKYVEALVHLQGFEELHPTNDQIPYVLWMKAVSYYEQFSSIDRDVTPLINARRELDILDTRFPENAHEQEAQALLKKILWRQARHDFYVARFYYRAGEYQASLARLYGILEKYRGEGITDMIMYNIGKCHFFLRDNEAAKEVLEALIKAYPNSKYVPRAKMFLGDIEKGRFTVVSKFFRFNERVFGYFGYQ